MANVTSKTSLGTVRAPQSDAERAISRGQEETLQPTIAPKMLEKKPPASKQYKSVPQNWTALPESKFRQVINHLESVLFEISTDGSSVNIPENRISPATLNRWADHLRAALKAVTAAK